jgi:hypothetical protein
MRDLNSRPHRPERCALPGCANPRRMLTSRIIYHNICVYGTEDYYFRDYYPALGGLFVEYTKTETNNHRQKAVFCFFVWLSLRGHDPCDEIPDERGKPMILQSLLQFGGQLSLFVLSYQYADSKHWSAYCRFEIPPSATGPIAGTGIKLMVGSEETVVLGTDILHF